MSGVAGPHRMGTAHLSKPHRRILILIQSVSHTRVKSMYRVEYWMHMSAPALFNTAGEFILIGSL